MIILIREIVSIKKWYTINLHTGNCYNWNCYFPLTILITENHSISIVNRLISEKLLKLLIVIASGTNEIKLTTSTNKSRTLAESRVLGGAGGPFRALWAGRPLPVHLRGDDVPCRAVVAHVQLPVPLPILVVHVTTTHLPRVRPRHLRVVTQFLYEPGIIV